MCFNAVIQGWVCPQCRRSLSPLVDVCPCHKETTTYKTTRESIDCLHQWVFYDQTETNDIYRCYHCGALKTTKKVGSA